MEIKKIISIFLVGIILFISIFSLTASAAGITNLLFNSKTVEVGSTFVATVVLKPEQEMYATDFVLTYDPEILVYNKTEVSQGKGFEIVTANPAGAIAVQNSNGASPLKSFTIKFYFIAKSTGSSPISVRDIVYTYRPTATSLAQSDTLPAQSANVTVKDKELPANANLSSLTLSIGKLSPNFTAARTNYTVSVPYENDKITLYAKTSDNKAKVAISSNPTNLNVGANTITLTVTAQNGAQKSYKIVVTRRQQGENPPTTETPPTETTNPFDVNISGKNYEILQQIPVENVFKGFTLTTADFKGNQVQVIKDKSNAITAYFLKESGAEAVAPYTYNAELESFELLKYITVNDTVYVFKDFPENTVLSSDYYSNFTQIGNFSVSSYLSIDTQLSDFSYVYCLVNGESGLYCYDTKEGTIQRAVNVHLMDVEASTTPERDDFLSRFNSLTTNGKVLLIAMLVAALCFVVLVIFLIIMAINKLFKKDVDIDQNDEFDFEDVIVVGDDNAKDDQ